MGNQQANQGDTKPTIHIGSADADRADDLGVGQKPPSTVYTKALENWEKHENLKDEKETELRSRVVDIKEECGRWGIEFSELI